MTEKTTLPVLAVSEFDCAKATGMSVSFLRKDRIGKQLIPYIKVGKRVLYDLAQVRCALRNMQTGGAK